jgi:hypothetical protein
MSVEGSIQEAKRLLISGDKNQAGDILLALVQDDPKCDQAWLLLEQCVDRPDQKLFCLKKALYLNPTSEEIRARYKQLEWITSVTPQESSEEGTPEEANQPAPQEDQQNPPAKKPVREIGLLIFGLGLLALCIFAAVAFINVPAKDMPTLPKNQITYRIDGTAKSVMVSFNNGTWSAEQKEVHPTWEQRYTMSAGSFPYILVVNEGGGSVFCEIQINGKTWKRAKAPIESGIILCGGWLGPSS